MHTKSGIIVPVIVVVAAIAVFGANEVIDTVTGLFDGASTEIIGDGGTQVMIASNTKSVTDKCTVPQMIASHHCGDLAVLLVNTRKMPFIARHTKLAWESGHPAILTMNRAKQDANRRIACPVGFPKKHAGQCDEYPMAATDQGGHGASTEEVPPRENQCQGGSYGAQYPGDGDNFLVVIEFPDDLATTPYAGKDIAKDKGWC